MVKLLQRLSIHRSNDLLNTETLKQLYHLSKPLKHNLSDLSIHRSNDLLKSDEKISSGTCILIRPVSIGECYPDGLGNFIQLKFFKRRHEYFGKLNSIDFIPGLISYTSLFQRILQKAIVEFDIMCSKDASVKE